MGFDTKRLLRCGDDVRISDFVEIRYPEMVTIGSRVAIDAFVSISTQLEIGSFVHIGPSVSVVGGKAAKFVMKDFAGLSAGCRIICTSDDFLGSGLTNPMVDARFSGKQTVTTIVMDKHSLLGTNCIVFPGAQIGEGSVVSAGSVVKKRLEPWTVYAGNPAVAVAPRRKDKILEFEAKIDEVRRQIPNQSESSAGSKLL